MSQQTLAALLPLCLVVAADVWVYLDATRRANAGERVEARVGSWTIDSPAAWGLGCLVLFIVFLPMYLVARHPR